MRIIIERFKPLSVRTYRAKITLIWTEKDRQFQKCFYRDFDEKHWTWWDIVRTHITTHYASTAKAAIAAWRLTR